MLILKQNEPVIFGELPKHVQEEITEIIGEQRNPDMEDLEGIVEENDELNYTARQLFRYIRNARENRRDRNEFYDQQRSPVISRLELVGYPMRATADAKSNHIHEMNENEIRPSATLLDEDNLQSAIESLNGYKDNDPAVPNHDPPFSEQDIQNMDKILRVLEGIDVDMEVQDVQVNIDRLADFFGDISAIDIVEGTTRTRFYEYWQRTNTKFRELVEAFTNMEQAWLEANTLRLGEEEERVIEVGQAGIEMNIPENIQDKIENIKQILEDEKLVLPNYIIQMPTISARAHEDEDKVKYLVTRYMQLLGEIDIPRRLKPYTREVGQQIRVEGAGYDEEGQEIDPHELAEIEPDAAIESEEERLESKAREQLEILGDLDEVDPYFAILLAKEPRLMKVNEELIEQAIREIKDMYTFDLERGQEIEERFDEHISKFMDIYRIANDVAERDVFFLHLTDDPTSVKAIQNAFKAVGKATVNVQYAHVGKPELHTQAMEYNKAIEYINNETNKVMNILSDMLEVTNTRLPLERARGGRRTPEGAEIQTPTFIERQPELGKVNEELMNALPLLMNSIEEYYITPLSSEMVILDDIPKFATSEGYRKVVAFLNKSFNALVVKTLLRDGIVTIRDKDIDKITKYFKELRKGTEIEYTDTLKTIASNALEGLLKLYGGLAGEKDEADNLILDILMDKYENLFGTILYDIALADIGEEEARKERWEGHVLLYYLERYEQEEQHIENLYTLLVDPQIKTFIGKTDSGTNKIKSAVERLKKELTRSEIKDLMRDIAKAMLESYDLLRLMNGGKIYKGSLDIDDYEEVDFVIRKIRDDSKVDIIVKEIETVLERSDSYDKIAKSIGISEELVYKIKGMFR